MKKNIYSKINTKTKIIKSQKNSFFDKEFRINISKMNNQKNLSKLFRILLDYYKNLKKTKINIPDVINFKLNRNFIFCRMRYMGENMFMMGLNEKNFSKFRVQFDQIIRLINIVKKKKINLDPHLKNFVVFKDTVYYVDIFPPYTKELEKMRQHYYINEYEKKILNKNFEFFYPKNLFYHMVSDMIKFNPKFKKKINLIYKILIQKKVIFSSKNFFLKKVNEILKIEKIREQKKLYLI